MPLSSLVKIRPRNDALMVSRGRSVLITAPDGFVDPDSQQGLFVHETRLLSKHRYLLNQEEFRPIVLSNIEQHSWLGYYIQLAPEMKHGSLGGSGGVPKESEHSIELLVHRTVGEGLQEDLRVTNYNQITTSFSLDVEVDADFADVEELPDKRKQFGDLTRVWRKGDRGNWELNFDYRVSHHYEHQGNVGDASLHRGLIIKVRESDSEPHLHGSSIRFDLTLKPHQTWHAELDFIPLVEDQKREDQDQLHSLQVNPAEFDEKRRSFLSSSTSLEIPGQDSLAPVVGAALERAKQDLAALRLYDVEESGGWTMAAGIPLYIALFGRDTLITAWQAVALSPQILRGTLNELMKWRAERVNEWRDATPNGMLHEAHTGPLSLLNYTPRSRYYGTLTTPSFYPVALSELWRWTGDSAFAESVIDTALRSLKWMQDYSRSSRDGFFQYKTSSEQGVKNQGWKDSSDAIVYEDGSQVSDPIAPCEGQGYYFAGCQQLSQVLYALGLHDEARQLRDGASEFKKRFNEGFWMEDKGLFALGLDGTGRQIKSVASNASHVLGTGIADKELGARTVDRLFRDDMFSGWGMRTLSSEHPAYNPYSYHRGTVWPVEQGSFVIGLARYNAHSEMQRLCQAQFELVELFEHFRLPEVLSGHQRDSLHPFPALYPDTNWPQAWSASAIFAMLASMLGLFAFAPYGVLFVDPQLPAWLPEITVRNLQVGQSVVDLHFLRQNDGSSSYEILDLKGQLRIERRPDAWSLLGLLGDELRDQISA